MEATLEVYAALCVLQAAGTTGMLYVLRKFDKSLDSYMTEKGKNLATKEDIEEITRKIESVKTDLVSKTELRKVIAVRKLALIDEIVAKADEMTRKGVLFGTQVFADDLNEFGKLLTRSEHLLSLQMVEQMRYFLGSTVAHTASVKHLSTLPGPVSTERVQELVRTFVAERDRMIAVFRKELHVDDDDNAEGEPRR
jgi:hypothetical protein